MPLPTRVPVVIIGGGPVGLLLARLLQMGGVESVVYGQTEVTKDLYAALDAAGVTIVDRAAGVRPHGVDGDAPYVTFTDAVVTAGSTASTAPTWPAATASTASAAP